MTLTRIVGGLAAGTVLFAAAKFGGYVVAMSKIAQGQHGDLRDVGEASVAPGPPTVVGERAASLHAPRRAPDAIEDEANVIALREYLAARDWHPSVGPDAA